MHKATIKLVTPGICEQKELTYAQRKKKNRFQFRFRKKRDLSGFFFSDVAKLQQAIENRIRP